MKNSKDYYIKELNSLRIEGAEFAKKNPGLSSFLSKEGQDPDVERMLEGFAFLTGKLHQKFDEELPEVAHNLVQLLWPNYIRPVPSYSIIKFGEIKNDLNNQTVPSANQILSEENTSRITCKFKTCFETKVMPLQLSNVEYLTFGQKSSIELDLKMSVSGSLADINFETLRIFLGGSKFMSKELYLYLDRYVEKIDILVKDKDNEVINSLTLPKKSIKSVGFDVSETIVPQPRNIFDGYVMLQEYFSYQDKHLFMDILNLNNISDIDGDLLCKSKFFTIQIYLSKCLSTAQLPVRDDFQLYCTPVINIFESDAVPIRKSEIEDEYLLTPSELKKEQSEVFSIENVRGWIPSKNLYQDYFPFESFSHTQEKSEYYSTRVKLNDASNRIDSFIRFASAGGTFDNLEHNSATVSVKMLCTNKDIPSKLQLGDLSICDPLSEIDLKFENITIPSISYPPPIGGDFLWKLISNISLNYLSLENIETLKMIIQTYDFFGANDQKQKDKTDVMLSGLKSISYKRVEMIYEGLPIRGIETRLLVDPLKFAGLGDAYLFCCVLNEFFALYCNVNSFHRLIVDMQQAETFSWSPKMGHQALV